MTALVLDCSVVLATLAKDEEVDFAGTAMDHVAAFGAVVPSLFFAELANGLLMMLRRRRMDDLEVQCACAAVASLPIVTRESPGLDFLHPLIDLAHAHGLTAYDAAYLDLALRERLPLATLDEQLAAAARVVGVPIFSP